MQIMAQVSVKVHGFRQARRARFEYTILLVQPDPQGYNHQRLAAIEPERMMKSNGAV
jgi:hypothetical protein